MKQFIIEEAFWEVFPEAKIGIVLAKGINNRIEQTEVYEPSCESLKKGVRSSIEALLKRVSNGNAIGTINPLVDLYNSISLKFGLPCGGEDIETFVGNVLLTKAKGDEPFVTLGTDENAPPYEGEIVYLCIESVDASREEDFQAALNELSTLIQTYVGGQCQVFILDREHDSIEIES